MPFKLRKAPKRDLYWVINTTNGRKFSNDPIPFENAQGQLRILERWAVENRERFNPEETETSRVIEDVTSIMKTGAFTKQAKKAGMDTDKFADHVLKNPDFFTAATRRRAELLVSIRSKAEKGKGAGRDDPEESDKPRFIQDVTSHMKTGAFTKQAKKAGMETEEFADYVLEHPDFFTITTRRRAQFLVNIRPKSEKSKVKGGAWSRDINTRIKQFGTLMEERYAAVTNREELMRFKEYYTNGFEAIMRPYVEKMRLPQREALDKISKSFRDRTKRGFDIPQLIMPTAEGPMNEICKICDEKRSPNQMYSSPHVLENPEHNMCIECYNKRLTADPATFGMPERTPCAFCRHMGYGKPKRRRNVKGKGLSELRVIRDAAKNMVITNREILNKIKEYGYEGQFLNVLPEDNDNKFSANFAFRRRFLIHLHNVAKEELGQEVANEEFPPPAIVNIGDFAKKFSDSKGNV